MARLRRPTSFFGVLLLLSGVLVSVTASHPQLPKAAAAAAAAPTTPRSRSVLQVDSTPGIAFAFRVAGTPLPATPAAATPAVAAAAAGARDDAVSEQPAVNLANWPGSALEATDPAAATTAAAAEPRQVALDPPLNANAPLAEANTASSSSSSIAVLPANATANAVEPGAAAAVAAEPLPAAVEPSTAANAPLVEPTTASSRSNAVAVANANANAAAMAAAAARPVSATHRAAVPAANARNETTAAATAIPATAAAALPTAAARPTTAAAAAAANPTTTAAAAVVPAAAAVPPVVAPAGTPKQIPARPRPATAPGPLGAPPPGTAAAAAAAAAAHRNKTAAAAIPGNRTTAATAAAAAAATKAAPQQTAWHFVPDDDDLLISADNDHDDDDEHDESSDESDSSSSSNSSSSSANATADGKTKVTILHFNDWHMRVEATKNSYCGLCTKDDVDAGRCNGGLARMLSYIKQQRKRDPHLLVLNAGDDFIGTEWDRRTDMDAPAAFMNMMGVDAMTIGNHEWDKGLDAFKRYIDKLNTTHEAILGANIDFGGHQLEEKIKRYVVKTVKGKKICIFGLTTEYALPDSSKISPIKIQEPYGAGRQVLEELKGQGCHATILLSHLGYTSDLVAAKMLYGVDAVIGGHSHSFLWPDQYHPPAYYIDDQEHRADETWGPYPTFVHSSDRDIPVVQASWGSRYMGRLELEFDPESEGGKCSGVDGDIVLLGGPNSESHVEEDPVALEEIKKFKYW